MRKSRYECDGRCIRFVRDTQHTHTHAWTYTRAHNQQQPCTHYKNTNITSDRQKSEINSFISIVCWFGSSFDSNITNSLHLCHSLLSQTYLMHLLNPWVYEIFVVVAIQGMIFQWNFIHFALANFLIEFLIPANWNLFTWNGCFSQSDKYFISSQCQFNYNKIYSLMLCVSYVQLFHIPSRNY